MVHRCLIGCYSNSERKSENITFHTFPKNDLRQSWIRATGRANWEPTKNARICSIHFEENSFRRTKHMTYINPLSVPTLHVVELIPPMEKPSTSKDAMDAEKSPIPPMEKPSTSKDAMDAEKSPIPPMEKPSTSKDAMDVEKSPNKNVTPIEQAKSIKDEIITPRKQKLVKQLNRQKLLAQTRSRKLASLRSKHWRLAKKSAGMSAIIEKLQTKRYINQEGADLLASINPNNTHYLKSNRSSFSPEVRKFALNLQFISPHAYNFVRKTFPRENFQNIRHVYLFKINTISYY